jgi:glutamyl-tRNA synthetase
VAGEGQEIDRVWLSKAVATLQERSRTLVELAQSLRYYISEEVAYEEKAGVKFLNQKSLPLLSELREELGKMTDFSAAELEKVFTGIMERRQIKLGALAQPVRVALTGGTVSPGIFEVIEIMGREKTLKRLDKAIQSIGPDAA